MFSLKISNFCTLVQRISTMVLMCGTKFVPVTLVYHGYRYRAPISVIVNYLNDTTVGQFATSSNETSKPSLSAFATFWRASVGARRGRDGPVRPQQPHQRAPRRAEGLGRARLPGCSTLRAPSTLLRGETVKVRTEKISGAIHIGNLKCRGLIHQLYPWMPTTGCLQRPNEWHGLRM